MDTSPEPDRPKPASPPLASPLDDNDWNQPPVAPRLEVKQKFGPLDLDPGENWFHFRLMLIVIGFATVSTMAINLLGGSMMAGLTTGLFIGLLASVMAFLAFRRR
jgi:hypothetical protein